MSVFMGDSADSPFLGAFSSFFFFHFFPAQSQGQHNIISDVISYLYIHLKRQSDETFQLSIFPQTTNILVLINLPRRQFVLYRILELFITEISKSQFPPPVNDSGK
jgi:hypothetical protein